MLCEVDAAGDAAGDASCWGEMDCVFCFLRDDLMGPVVLGLTFFWFFCFLCFFCCFFCRFFWVGLFASYEG